MKPDEYSASVSKFNLKYEFVELVRAPLVATRAEISIEALEALRTSRQLLPASKHGLEVICGASCDTGAT